MKFNPYESPQAVEDERDREIQVVQPPRRKFQWRWVLFWCFVSLGNSIGLWGGYWLILGTNENIMWRLAEIGLGVVSICIGVFGIGVGMFNAWRVVRN